MIKLTIKPIISLEFINDLNSFKYFSYHHFAHYPVNSKEKDGEHNR